LPHAVCSRARPHRRPRSGRYRRCTATKRYQKSGCSTNLVIHGCRPSVCSVSRRSRHIPAISDSRALPLTLKGSRVRWGRTADQGSVSVRVLDRPSSTTATIAWSDPTSCYYGDQIWRASVARQSGVCATSGQPVRVGDEVYKPRCKPMPVNGGAAILFSVVDRTISDSGANWRSW
jgi:hypothetical protein